MGVSGSGKSSVGRAISETLNWTFIEGDDLHPPANRTKMASGQPLQDDDRWPWLDAIAATAQQVTQSGGAAIVACSALKRSYRDRLRRAGCNVKFIHLSGDHDTILKRMQARHDHFMPPGLLASQLTTLQPPSADENALSFDIRAPISEISTAAIEALNQPD